MHICDLAERTGIDRSVLGRWLSGVRTIRVRDADLVVRELGLVIVVAKEGQNGTSKGLNHRPGAS
ncbi:MAG: helix-turn-helix domain-containing protein [Phycisphaerales bacterium]